MNNFEDAPFHVDLPVFHSSFPLPYRVFLLIGTCVLAVYVRFAHIGLPRPWDFLLGS